jgi:hypothetical protein
MHICLVCCFYGRHKKVERILRCFINQDYKEELTLLLYNNSTVDQHLSNMLLPENKYIILINNHLDHKTGKEYTNTGDVFRDAMTYVPKTVGVVNFFDSDDVFLPSHASEGARRMKRAYDLDRLAYKPYFSYYIHDDYQIEKNHNTMEPSYFVDKEYVIREGFNQVACSYHQKWLNKLNDLDLLYMPLWGLPTFLYCWETGSNTHKISGLGDNANNFAAHRKWEQDNGDKILTPSNPEEVGKYYQLVEQYINQ